jgi:hypothetical protein
MPAIAFCSWTTKGIRSSHAAMPPGPLTKPPAPSTARGRMRRSTLPACMTALAMRSGASTQASSPLPRIPATRTHSIGNPCAGTKRDSMLSGTPSHTTAMPRSRNALATLSAGKTCPPVPPAMINTGPPIIALLASSRPRGCA